MIGASQSMKPRVAKSTMNASAQIKSNLRSSNDYKANAFSAPYSEE